MSTSSSDPVYTAHKIRGREKKMDHVLECRRPSAAMPKTRSASRRRHRSRPRCAVETAPNMFIAPFRISLEMPEMFSCFVTYSFTCPFRCISSIASAVLALIEVWVLISVPQAGDLADLVPMRHGWCPLLALVNARFFFFLNLNGETFTAHENNSGVHCGRNKPSGR